MLNAKILNRALAQSIVNNTSDVIALVANYYPVDQNISYADLILLVEDLRQANSQFQISLIDLMVEKGHLSDFNNATGIIGGISDVLSSLISSPAQKQQAYASTQAGYSENTQMLMQMVMQEEEKRVAEQQQRNNLIYLAIGGMVLLTGIFIFMKK